MQPFSRGKQLLFFSNPARSNLRFFFDMCVTALNSSWINELKNKSAIIVHHDASLEVGGNGAKNDFFMIVRGY